MELYIHIPFCIRKCAYCAFDSFPGCSAEDIAEYLCAVLQEARIRKTSEAVDTVYIGGGTPSLIQAEHLRLFLTELRGLYDLSPMTEMTAEANPGTVTASWMDAACQCGINRISLGMQSSTPRLLKTLGRIHTIEDVAHSVLLARRSGIKNLNLDLIFGIPGQTMADWNDTIDAALSFHPEHISAYGLIPEENTPMFRKLKSGELSLPDPDLERDMYDLAIQRFGDAGLIQYEISNFAKEGFECRHNIGYWEQIPYLGLGLSAASMSRLVPPTEHAFSIRRTNPCTFSAYYDMLKDPGCPAAETTVISEKEARFETMMLSLRLTKGMNRERFRHLHGDYPEAFWGNTLNRLREQNLLTFAGDSWRLTRRGMDIQNAVLLEFMDD